MSYRIRTVSEMTGIPRNTLIAWERRYGFLHPARHDNDYRSYSEEDVARLLRVKNALTAGLKISEAIELVQRSESREAKLEVQPTLSEPSESRDYSQLLESVINLLLNYQGQKAEQELRGLESIGYEERIQRVYFPILQQIGLRWERGEVSIAQEHYASAIIRAQLISMLVGVGARSSSAPHAVSCTVPGEQHEMGALALGVRLGLAGYRITYLGANLPVSEALAFCLRQKPQLLCLSSTLDLAPEDALQMAHTLAPLLAQGMRVVLDGRGVRRLESEELLGLELAPSWAELKL